MDAFVARMAQDGLGALDDASEAELKSQSQRFRLPVFVM
jgi:hypothetical protein